MNKSQKLPNWVHEDSFTYKLHKFNSSWFKGEKNIHWLIWHRSPGASHLQKAHLIPLFGLLSSALALFSDRLSVCVVLEVAPNHLRRRDGTLCCGFGKGHWLGQWPSLRQSLWTVKENKLPRPGSLEEGSRSSGFITVIANGTRNWQEKTNA